VLSPKKAPVFSFRRWLGQKGVFGVPGWGALVAIQEWLGRKMG
jgi:hypothetical protein